MSIAMHLYGGSRLYGGRRNLAARAHVRSWATHVLALENAQPPISSSSLFPSYGDAGLGPKWRRGLSAVGLPWWCGVSGYGVAVLARGFWWRGKTGMRGGFQRRGRGSGMGLPAEGKVGGDRLNPRLHATRRMTYERRTAGLISLFSRV